MGPANATSVPQIAHVPAHVPAHAPNQAMPQNGSACWRGVVVAMRVACEIIIKVALFVILGSAALFLYPPIAPPFFAIAISFAAVRLVVKGIDCYNASLLDNAKKKVWGFISKHPKLQIIIFLFAVAISPLVGFLGIGIAASLGILNAFVTDAQNSRHAQQLQARLRR